MKVEKWNDGWLYWKEEDAFALVWEISPEAKKVTLPHDAMLEEYACEESRNKGNTGYRDGGVYQYSKELAPKEAERDLVFMIRFEGVYMNAFVYVNAQLVTRHPYGYTGFYVCLNDYLKFGQKNEIRVVVRNSGMANSRWYSGGGIYRDVYLLKGDRTYLRPDGTFITTETLEDAAAVILVENEICSKTYGLREIYLETAILDPSGTQVAAEKVPVTVMEGEQRKLECRFYIEKPKPWTAETPSLYKMIARIYDDTQTLIDEKEESFGIRTLRVDAARGFRVNGKPVKLRGACIHHDSGIIGAATFYDAEYRRISKLKEAGFNCVRMAHHPSAPALLRACDELGMYVMEEAFDMWDRCKAENDYALFFDQWWESDVEAMVRTAYCHPSVILYSVGNEIPEIGTGHGAKRCHELTSKIKSLDKTRFTLAGINGVFSVGEMIPQVVSDVVGNNGDGQGGNVNDFMAAMFGNMDKIVNHPEVSRRIEKACASTDIAGYNYMTDRYEPDGKAFPNRVIVGSETYPPAIAENWKIIKRNHHVIGDFTWTGWDYLGEAGVGVISYGESGAGMGMPFPCQIAYTGDFDVTGFRRPASYFREIVFGRRTEPYLCVQRPQRYGQLQHPTPWSLTDAVESWSFPGYEGKPVVVEVYAPGDEVELLVNGASVGRQKAGEEAGYRVLFETVYEPGTIRAVSYENGKETGSMELVSAGAPESVRAEVTTGIRGELYYIDLLHCDKEGRLITEEDILITLTTDAEVELHTGSGSHSPLMDYKDGKTMTWNGRALAIVRKTNREEQTELKLETKYGVETIKL